MTVQDTEISRFTDEWRSWHADREARLAAPHGFLAITGIHWLSDEPERFDDVPGAWSTDERGPRVVLADAEELVVDGTPVHGEHAFGVIDERGGIDVAFDDAIVEIAKRGGYDIVRPRHPENPLRLTFTGTPAYDPDPRWAVPARYVPFDEPRPVTVGAAVEGLQHVYDSPGRLEFEVDGQPLSLTAFNGATPGSLYVLFTDATSGVTTYAANRSLAIDAPDAQGKVTLDFNRATNLPCAYTDFATCPLPPTENHLPVGIEAGELMPVSS
jgi:uncharacterized protein (DUF1684 family)